MPAVRLRFLPPVRPIRELILYISGSVRFGFPAAGFWAVSGSHGSVPGSRFGSRTFLPISLYLGRCLYPYLYLSVSLPLSLSLSPLSLSLSISLPVYPSIHLFIRQPIYLAIYLSI